MFCLGQFLGFFGVQQKLCICAPKVVDEMQLPRCRSAAPPHSSGSVPLGNPWSAGCELAVVYSPEGVSHLEGGSTRDLVAVLARLELLVVLAVPGWDEGLDD